MTDEQLLERAAAQIGSLANAAGIRPIAMAVDMAGVGAEMLPSLLGHELIAGHAAMMRLMGKLDLFLDQIAAERPAEEQDRACRQAVQLSGAAARLTERYRLGLMSLARLGRWAESGSGRRAARPGRAEGADAFDDDPFDDGPGGGRKSPAKILAELAAIEKSMGAMLDKIHPNGAKPNGQDNGAQSQPAPDQACAPAGGPQPSPDRPADASVRRRGRLRHGNPSGDFLAAPRCGARTRAGCACKQPAMANGRCRLHGGKSTGARTAAGLARCRTATLVHGHRTAEIIDLKSAAARHGRRLRTIARFARHLVTPGPRSERPTPCPATSRPFAAAAAKRATPAEPTPPKRLRRPEATFAKAGEHGYAQMNTDGARASRRHGLAASAFIPSYLRPSVAKPSSAAARNPRSERPTACPATAGKGMIRHSHGHGMSALPFIRPSCYSMAGSQAMGTPDRDDRGRYRIAAAA